MAPRLTHNVNDELEAQLAGVIEQDGITMATADGIRRRATRIKKTRTTKTSKSIFFDTEAPPQSVDHVADLDAATVGLMVATEDGESEQPVKIIQGERPKSAFVLSLRGLSLREEERAEDERVSLDHAFRLSTEHATSGVPGVYGTLTQDLTLDGYDPHVFADQFTPADFFVAHAQVYGHFDRLTVALHTFVADLTGLFQRVERVEEHLVDEVRDTLTLVEVPRLSVARAFAGFVGLLLVVTLPANAIVLYRSATKVQNAAVGAGTTGLNDLLAIGGTSALPASIDALKRASTQFREADAIVDESGALAVGVASVMPSQYRSARALLEIGDKSSEAGRLLAMGFDKVFHDSSRSLDERLDVLAAYANAALPLLSDASKAAASVDASSIPENKRAAFTSLTGKLDQATNAVRDFSGLASFGAGLLGKERTRTYLLVFQNQTELRPTGGFMGSIAEVSFDRGKVSKLFVPPGGTYDLKGQLLEHVISPAPLHLINAHWQFQDANWSPDFPTAAKKLRWFWSKSGGPTIDGVIAINASFEEHLLDVTGPIDMPAYGKVIDSSNFILETQKAVELEYDKTANTPKKFVGDLAQAMLERLKALPQDQWLTLAAAFSEALQTKDIQVAMSDESDEQLAERYGWSGQIKPTTGDSLALIEANIAGQKTDGVIDEAVQHQVDIRDDGSITDTVTLSRTHHGTKGELFRGVRNVSYLRVYVPEGSELESASGFDTPPEKLFKKPDDDYRPDVDVAAIENSAKHLANGVDVMTELSRTVFGGWMQLDPGQTQTITLRYRLPQTISDIHAHLEAAPEQGQASRAAYTLLLTSQSGKATRMITSTVNVPANYQVTWTHGADSNTASTVTMSGTWDRDKVIAALLSPR